MIKKKLKRTIELNEKDSVENETIEQATNETNQTEEVIDQNINNNDVPVDAQLR